MARALSSDKLVVSLNQFGPRSNDKVFGAEPAGAQPFVANLVARALPGHQFFVSLNHTRLKNQVLWAKSARTQPFIANLVTRALSDDEV